MSMTAVYAIAAPITAFVCCAFISFMMKYFKLEPKPRMIIVYIIYVRLCFVMEAGGNGLLHVDLSTFVMQRFIFRVVAGIFVCVAMYLFYTRDEVEEKYRDYKKNKNKKK